MIICKTLTVLTEVLYCTVLYSTVRTGSGEVRARLRLETGQVAPPSTPPGFNFTVKQKTEGVGCVDAFHPSGSGVLCTSKLYPFVWTWQHHYQIGAGVRTTNFAIQSIKLQESELTS